MEPVRKFTVVRSRWLRGTDDSSLLDGHERMCCLGFVCVQRGVNRDALLGCGDPQEVAEFDRDASLGSIDGVLLNRDDERDRWRNSELTNSAIRINDDHEIADPEREARLSKLFAEHGFEMAFVDEATP